MFQINGGNDMKDNEEIQVLADLVHIDNRNGNELPVAEYLKHLFDEHGVKSEILPLSSDPTHRANLVAEIGSGKPVIAFTGHMDVVDFDKSEWDTDPLTLTIKDNKMFGRGATDMKSGVAATALAMIALHEKQVPLNGTIRLLATAGEEVGMNGSEELEANGYMDDVDALVVGEPSGLRIGFANKGELNVTLTAQGKAAHSSMPDLGINALQNLVDAWQDIKQGLESEVSGSTDEDLGKLVFNLDVLNAGTQPNVIPGDAEAQINVRTTPEFDNDAVFNLIQNHVERFNQTHQGTITVTNTMDIKPVKGDKNAKLIQLIEQVAKKHNHDDIPVLAAPGGTDASRLLLHKSIGFPLAVFGPGNPLVQHQANEYCDKDMYLQFVTMYQELMTEVLK